MVDLQRIEALLDQRRPGHALPRAFYTDPEVFEFDQVAIHRRAWILAGFEVELPRTGSHMALTVAGAPVFVVRGQDGALRGFHNTCRHRGSRIVAEGKGSSARLVCPYHRWTYDLSGDLVHAARMGDDFAQTLLHVHVAAQRALALPECDHGLVVIGAVGLPMGDEMESRL